MHMASGQSGTQQPALQICAGRVAEALKFGEEHVAAFLRDETLPAREATQLRNTLALLAYPTPSEAPMAYLLQARHRELVADTVNVAVLQHSVRLQASAFAQAGKAVPADVVGVLAPVLTEPEAGAPAAT